MSEYLDGDLPVRGRARMERHVAVCHECHTVLVELRLLIDHLHRLPSAVDGDASQIAAAVRVRLSRPSGT
jgi:anti-sigma factor RsiW